MALLVESVLEEERLVASQPNGECCELSRVVFVIFSFLLGQGPIFSFEKRREALEIPH